MLSLRRSSLLLLSLVSLAALPGTGTRSAPATPRYTVTDLGTLGGAESDARALNDSGVVVGASLTSEVDDEDQPIQHAYRWGDGVLTDLDTGGAYSEANAINRRGDIAGGAAQFDEYREHAYMWPRGGRARRLDIQKYYPTDTTWATGINDAGIVVGGAWNDLRDYTHPYLWNGRMVVQLFGEQDSLASDINDRGAAVGYVWGPIVIPDGAVWPGTREFRTIIKHDKDGLGPGNAAYAINGQGRIVGFLGNTGYLAAGREVHALPPLAGFDRAVALALNGRSDAVGCSYSWGGADTNLAPGKAPYIYGTGHACLWRVPLVLDLNALIPADSAWVLQSATGINNRGQIVGTGLHHGVRRGFLLTPQ